MGDSLAFTVTVQANKQATEQQKMVVDYAVHHRKANGKTTAKVFKLKNIVLAADENQAICLTKKHSFRPIITRTYYAGEHRLEILVNGKAVVERVFSLVL